MKTAVVGGMIVGAHCVIIGSVLLMGGCGKTGNMAGPDQSQSELHRAVMPPVEPELTPPKVTLSQDEMGGGKITQPADMQKYVVKRGDMLSSIAHKHGVSVKELSKLNNITNPNKVKVGQELMLPGQSGAKSVVTKATPKSVVASDGMKVYTVVKGDVLSRIAVRHGTTSKELMTKNELTSDKLKVGQKLVVPAKEVKSEKSSKTVAKTGAKVEAPAVGESAPVSAPVVPSEPAVTTMPAAEEPGATVPAVLPEQAPGSGAALPDPVGAAAQPFTHDVVAGETLQMIADKYGVSIDKLMSINNLSSKDINPPLTLKLP